MFFVVVASEKLKDDLNSGVLLAYFLVFQYKKNLTASRLTVACFIKDSEVSGVSPEWWLVVVAQQGTPGHLLGPSDCQAASLGLPQPGCTGDHAARGLERFRVLWGLQQCDHEWESGLPKTGLLTCAWACLGKTQVAADGFPRVLSTSAGAAIGSGAQDSTVLVMSGLEQTAQGDSCHVLACGLMETLAYDYAWQGLRSARPPSPFAKEVSLLEAALPPRNVHVLRVYIYYTMCYSLPLQPKAYG